jgi:hypothetical protein
MKKLILFLVITAKIFATENSLQYFDQLCIQKLQIYPHFTYDVTLESHEKTDKTILIIQYDDVLIYRTYVQIGDYTLFVDEKFTFFLSKQEDSFLFPEEMNKFYKAKQEKDAVIHELINDLLYENFGIIISLNKNESAILQS